MVDEKLPLSFWSNSQDEQEGVPKSVQVTSDISSELNEALKKTPTAKDLKPYDVSFNPKALEKFIRFYI